TGPALYAVGYFRANGAVELQHVAKWDGISWSRVGATGGVMSTAYCVAEFDEDGDGPQRPNLFVGAATAGGIARWDGAAWSAVGTGADSNVRVMHSFDPDGPGPEPAALYAGLEYYSPETGTIARLRRWDGSASSIAGPDLRACEWPQCFGA